MKYLGKVLVPKLISSSKSFEEFCRIDMEKEKASQVIKELIRYELSKHGFNELRSNLLALEQYTIDLTEKEVFLKKENSKAKAAIKLNNDFLTSYTLRKLMNFKSSKENVKDVGEELAKVFIHCGIPIPKEVFILLFNKIYNEGGVTKV